MKFSLVFLCVFAFVGSHQQAFHFSNLAWPRHFSMGNILLDSNPSLIHLSENYVPLELPTNEGFPEQELNFRTNQQPLLGARFNSLVNLPNGNPIAPRFFYANNQLGFSGGSNNGLIKTVVYVSTATTTVASVSKCIAMDNFVAGSQTVPCPARKRREIASILDSFVLTEEDKGAIAASPTTLIEPTVSSVEIPKPGIDMLSDTIESSKDDIYEGKHIFNREKRFFNLFVMTTTVTSFSFITTVIPKQVSIVDAASPSALICLPSGYGVC